MEKCQRCNLEDEDCRTLWMSCFYEMDELKIPFQHECQLLAEAIPAKFYTLRVCKPCRSFWLGMIKVWFDNPVPLRESCGSGIFVREFGATVEITREEWDKRAPGFEPVIYKEKQDD